MSFDYKNRSDYTTPVFNVDLFDLTLFFLSSGVKPYKCPSCDKAFTQRCSLESHTKKVHGMDLPYGYKERRAKVNTSIKYIP